MVRRQMEGVQLLGVLGTDARRRYPLSTGHVSPDRQRQHDVVDAAVCRGRTAGDV